MTCLCTCLDSLKSSSEFNRRNQPAKRSCKTCGGSSLVDGIRSVSSNMLSTVGLEVAKSINLELSWKTVTKGRRSRKAIARRLNEGMKVVNRSPKRVGDFLGSDFDKKIAEAGCWSSDKVEHVPIKKRRHLLQTSLAQSQNPSIDHEDSLSPQSLATPGPSEGCEQILVYNHTFDHWSSDPYSSGLMLEFERKATRKFGLSDGVADAKISKVANGKLYNSEDFSGIALLAAAACIDVIDDDPDNAKEPHVMIASATPGGSAGSTLSQSKEILALNELMDPGRGDMRHASNTEASTVNESAVAPKGFAEFKEPSVVDRLVSPKVDRMHWDLNTIMDTWEEPPKDSSMENVFCEGFIDDAHKEKLKIEICDKKRDFEDYKYNFGKGVPLDQNGAISEFASVKAEVCKLESVSVNDGIFDEEIFFGNLGRQCTKALDSLSAQRETFDELVTGDASLDDSSFVKSHNASDMPVSNGLTTAASNGLILTQIGDSSVKAVGFSKAPSSNNVPFPAKSGCESASQYIDRSDPIMTGEVSDTSISNAMGVESSDSNPTETDFCNHSSKCEALSASKASIAEGQSVVVEPMEKHYNVLAVDSQMQLEGKEVISNFSDSYTCDEVKKCTFLRKDSSRSCNEELQIDTPSQFTKSASAFEDSHNSEISQEDYIQIEAGYDSPFEDGELRGSIIYSWEDNEIEDEENECVDYESDGRDDVYSDAIEYPAAEIVEARSEGSQSIEKRISSTNGCQKVDYMKVGSPRNFMTQFNREGNNIVDNDGKRGLGTGFGSTTQRFGDKIEGKENAFRKRHTSDRMATYEFKGSYMKEISSKTNKGKLQSRNEGPLYFDTTDGKSAALKYQNRPHNVIGYNSRDGGATDGQWNRWNSRNSYPYDYHGFESHNYSRRHNFVDKFGGLNSRDHQQSIIFSSEGVRRPLMRRRLPVERDDYYDFHRRMVPVPVRGGYQSRGRAGSFSQRVVRGIREEGYEPIPGEGDSSSVRMPRCSLRRRERIDSPASGRGTRISLSRRRSCSRSRTPPSVHTHRKRNFSTKRHGRSPNLRSDARMERMRMPLRKQHDFTTNYGDDFSSPARGRCRPPERGSRWIDGRSCTGEHSKNKWSRKER